jgi:hypothetical protein
MAETAFQTQYRQEVIAAFEMRQSLLRSTTVTETVIKGNTATFLVAGSGGATAVTRGVNGLIPARANDLTQTSATLAEWHDLVRVTGFNIFASQGDQRQIMQKETMAVINRKIDADIIAQLDTATIDTGTSATASLAMVAKAKAALGYADVPTEEQENVFGLVTPGFMGYLMQVKEFASAEYVDVKPLVGPTRKMLRWFGVNWIEHPNLTGAQTSTEKCYLYHRNAIGHAVNTAGISSPVGYDEEQDYSYARCSVYMGSKLLQNSGIVQMKHDGSSFSLS